MKLHCKDCNYKIKKEDEPTATCPKCNSIYLIPVDDSKNKESLKLQIKQDKKNKKIFKIFSYSAFITAVSIMIYIYYECERLGGSCPRIGRAMIKFLKVFF